MKKLLIATKNPGKLQEITAFLQELPLIAVSLSQIGIDDDIEEDGETYEENAKKKALFYAKLSGLPALSDDGGIEIVALNNEPGIKSRRWIGENATEAELLLHMQKVAKALPENNRKARFVNVIAFALPTGEVWTTRGEIEGEIAVTPIPDESVGLPYRRFFFLPELGKYYHEKSLPEADMRGLNHRRKSIDAMKPLIKEKLISAD